MSGQPQQGLGVPPLSQEEKTVHAIVVLHHGRDGLEDIDLVVGEGAFGGTERERIGEALLPFADGLAFEDVEDRDGFEVRQVHLADEVDDVLVAELGGRDERYIAGNARELGDRDVVFGLPGGIEKHVELDQRDEERRRKAHTLGEFFGRLSEYTCFLAVDDEFSTASREEPRIGRGDECERGEAASGENGFQNALQVKEIKLGAAFLGKDHIS